MAEVRFRRGAGASQLPVNIPVETTQPTVPAEEEKNWWQSLVDRFNDNGAAQAMQGAGFYGAAGTTGAGRPTDIFPKITPTQATPTFNKALGTVTPEKAPVSDEADLYEQWMASRMGGEFDSSAYDNYINYLMGQDTEMMARIQAMYNQLAEQAGANMQRVADVYEGSGQGIGSAYDSATGTTGEAYASAQQQAADQLARLGIEAAAPAVVNPMALSQAEALSQLEAGRAAGLGANQRFGATAQDFASQMGQVAQQQGLEVSSQILRDIANRQAEAVFAREQARAQYNPYASALQELEARNAWNSVYGSNVDPEAEAEFLYRQEQDDVKNFDGKVEFYIDQLPGSLDERRARAYEAAMRDAQTGQFGPRLKAEADAYFAGQRQPQ
jgi:hypothetical protein